jgi:hypothetical protein
MEGANVMVYYDRENFEESAQIHAAKPCRIKGQEYGPGDFICEAPWRDRPGMFLGGDLSGHDVRKAWRNAVMSAYTTLVKHAPSRQLPAEIAARRATSVAANGLRPEGIGQSAPIVIDGRPTPAPQPVITINPEKERRRREREEAQAEFLRGIQTQL